MKHTKLMNKLFSENGSADLTKKVEDGIKETKETGSALVQDGDSTYLMSTDPDDKNAVLAEDLNNDEVTKFEADEDYDEAKVSAVKTAEASCGSSEKYSLPKDKSCSDDIVDDMPEDTTEDVTVTEVTPDEEYEVKVGDETFSVKGTFSKAVKVARKFGRTTAMFSVDTPDSLDVAEKVEGSVARPEAERTNEDGVVDPTKADQLKEFSARMTNKMMKQFSRMFSTIEEKIEDLSEKIDDIKNEVSDTNKQIEDAAKEVTEIPTDEPGDAEEKETPEVDPVDEGTTEAKSFSARTTSSKFDNPYLVSNY